MKYKVSCDAGNSTIKTLINGEKAMIFENIVADPSNTNYLKDPDLIGSGIQKLDVTVQRHFDKTYGEKNHFLYGKITDKHKAYREARGDKFKANDPQLADSMVTSVVYSILYYQKKAGNNIDKLKTLNISLNTGLPFHEWIIKEQREKFKKNLKGNHTIEFNHPWFKKNSFPEKLEIVISDVTVLVEGETTANLILNDVDNEFHKYSPQELIDNIVVLIDIGAYTTEIIGKQFVEVVQNDEDIFGESDLEVEHQTLPNLSEGIRRGIGHVFESSINTINQKYPKLDRLIRQDIQNALGKKGTRNGKSGYLLGEDINILEDFKLHAKDYSDYIATQIENIYNKNESKRKIKRIYLTGGGSQIDVVIEELKNSLKADDINPDLIVPITDPNPIFSNCLGYHIETSLLEEELDSEGEMVI